MLQPVTFPDPGQSGNETSMQRELPEAGGLERAVSDFVSEWRRELAGREEEGGGDREERLVLGKRKDGEHDQGQSSPVKTPKGSGHDREPSPLLVLPAGRGEREAIEGRGQTVEPSASGERTLVDALIRDLVSLLRSPLAFCDSPWPSQDEVNTVPFFDVQLPREVALIIFSYLSVADLCTCARVRTAGHGYSSFPDGK